MPLTKRLALAFSWLSAYRTVADIGCDHGKLSAALAAEPGVGKVVASDISAQSLDKARALAEKRQLTGKLELRLGDGLAVLSPGECEAAAVLGLGGEAMVKMLREAAPVAERLRCLVLQPMSGTEELREWLYNSGYSVTADRLVAENGRLFQMLAVHYTGERDPWPEGFPPGCFLAGYTAFRDGDPLLGTFCRWQLSVRERKLGEAEGSVGAEKLENECRDLKTILARCENGRN